MSKRATQGDNSVNAERMERTLGEYHKELNEIIYKQYELYDRTVLTLSGGALAVTIVFLPDMFKGNVPHTAWALLGAWSGWGLSIGAILVSYLCGIRAMNNYQNQIVQHLKSDTGKWIEFKKPLSARFVTILNISAAITTVVGLIFMFIFAKANMHSSDNNQWRVKVEQTEEIMAANDRPATRPSRPVTGGSAPHTNSANIPAPPPPPRPSSRPSPKSSGK